MQWWLLLCLFAPLAELFPDLYLSWWTPPNLKLTTYIRRWPSRVICVLVVWLPIIFQVSRISTLGGTLGLGATILAAFALRVRLLGDKLKAFVATVGNPTIIADAPPRPDLRRLSSRRLLEEKLPELLYFAAFARIAGLLYYAVPSAPWLALVGVGLIFVGAFGISRFRHLDLRKDVAGRLVFTAGFLINLYNLSRIDT